MKRGDTFIEVSTDSLVTVLGVYPNVELIHVKLENRAWREVHLEHWDIQRTERGIRTGHFQIVDVSKPVRRTILYDLTRKQKAIFGLVVLFLLCLIIIWMI